MTQKSGLQGSKKVFYECITFEALTLSRPQFPLLWGLDVSVGKGLAMQNLSLRHRIYILNRKAWGCTLLLSALGKWRLVDSSETLARQLSALIHLYTHTHTQMHGSKQCVKKLTGQQSGNDFVVSGGDTHSRCSVFTEVRQISSTQCLQGCAHSRHSEFTLPIGTVVKIVTRVLF